VDKIEDAAGINASITIGAGDCFIPGAFLSAGNDSSTRTALKTALGFTFGYNASSVDLRENSGRPDIAIMNSIGFDATCIGNHEWDLGATEFANIVLPVPQTTRTNMRHYGAAFPFLSANLSFSADSHGAILSDDKD
jgi:2',3'-cyclic-nucleotide 2'-phosphodiesterase (5'-nucleotidase family)